MVNPQAGGLCRPRPADLSIRLYHLYASQTRKFSLLPMYAAPAAEYYKKE